ncbi:MAG TPA: hypothetical protein DEQ77_10800 [Candidatus Omnitrophica bacterium]|nr:hypothetical protein [Candidatus Omnitrophota bacterium]
MAIKTIGSKKSNKFFKAMLARSREQKNPLNVTFEITRRCNFYCPYCYRVGGFCPRQELNIKEITAILRQMADAGVLCVAFTGGEPFAREDIFDILECANRCGFKFNLMTNGYFIDENAADRLKDVNINKVDISFNFLSPAAFDKFSGVKGSFVKVKNAIEILSKKNIPVALKATGMTLNKNELVALSRYARNLRVPFYLDAEVSVCHSGCGDFSRKHSLDNAEVSFLMKAVYPEMFRPEAAVMRIKSRARSGRMFSCAAGRDMFSVNPYGEMNFCVQIDYPRYNILAEGGIKSCWERIKNEINRLNTTKDYICVNCDIIKYCTHCCPGRAFAETGSFNSCSEYLRNMALERKREKEIPRDQ